MRVVVLLAVAAATFANALGNDFVFDDQLVIVDDPAVRLPLSAGFEGLYYRPLRTLSYRIDHALGGMDPRIFHLGNIVYHGVAACLVYALLGALGAPTTPALLGALVFAVHPVQADSVTYAAGRRDVLCGLFYVLGTVAYLRHRRTGSSWPLVLACIAYVLGILSKEMAVTLPLACLLIDRWWARQGDKGRSMLRFDRTRFGVLALLAAVGFAALARTYGDHIVSVATGRPWHGGSFGANLATVARVWVKYLQLVIWPSTLSADYSYDAFPVSNSPFDPWAVASVLVVLAFAVLAWASWRRGERLGLGLAWIAVALLPVSHLIPFRELLAEHYLYIPMVGVAMVVSGLADTAMRRWPARRPWLAAVAVLIVGALAARTVVRNRDWADRVTLWSATVAVVPRCARAHFNLGQAYFERTRLAEAEREWLAAAALLPADRDTQRALATLDHRLGRYEVGAAKVDALLAANPDDPDTLVVAGNIALDRGRVETARAYFDAALVLLPPARAALARSGRDRAVQASAKLAPGGMMKLR